MHTLLHTLDLFTLWNYCWEHTAMRQKCRKLYSVVYVGPGPAISVLWETPSASMESFWPQFLAWALGPAAWNFLQNWKNVDVPKCRSWICDSSIWSLSCWKEMAIQTSMQLCLITSHRRLILSWYNRWLKIFFFHRLHTQPSLGKRSLTSTREVTGRRWTRLASPLHGN